jgi:hypothetical protein
MEEPENKENLYFYEVKGIYKLSLALHKIYFKDRKAFQVQQRRAVLKQNKGKEYVELCQTLKLEEEEHLEKLLGVVLYALGTPLQSY